MRYRYEGEPTSIGLCQCRRCQRQSGSVFLIGLYFVRRKAEFGRANTPTGATLFRWTVLGCG